MIHGGPNDRYKKPPLREIRARFIYYKDTLEKIWHEYHFSRAWILTLNGMIPNVIKYSIHSIFYFVVEGLLALWQGKRRTADLEINKIKKILLIRLDHIGDLLMTTPAIRALRNHFPNAKIDIMVGSWAADVLKNNPYMDRIFFYDLKWYNRGKKNFIQTLRNGLTRISVFLQNYDLTINFRGDSYTLLLTYLTGAPHRIAITYWDVEKYHSSRKKKYFTHEIIDDDQTHYIDLNLALLKVLEVDGKDSSLDLFIKKEDEETVKSFFKTGGGGKTEPLIALYPGCGWTFKGWQLEKYAALADWLMEEIRAQVIIVGGPNEKVKMTAMKHLMKSKPIDAVGKTTLQQLAALLKSVHLLIGNDGGVTHVAEAVKKPIICLWGPTPFAKFRPLGLHTTFIMSNFECGDRLCEQFELGKKKDCSNNLCMQAIPLQKVKETVIEVMTNLGLITTHLRQP